MLLRRTEHAPGRRAKERCEVGRVAGSHARRHLRVEEVIGIARRGGFGRVLSRMVAVGVSMPTASSRSDAPAIVSAALANPGSAAANAATSGVIWR
jgi:hypothetical protein